MKKQIISGLLVHFLFLGMLKAQVHSTHPVHPSESKKRKNSEKTQFGVASFYANKFNGRKMANGDLFSQDKLTAACNTVALNMWVRVTNLHNKKFVVVKVTDRMHYRNKRIIDLSKAAAKHLGYIGRGLTHVKVEVLGKKHPTEPVTRS